MSFMPDGNLERHRCGPSSAAAKPQPAVPRSNIRGDPMTPTPRLALTTIVATLAYLGLAITQLGRLLARF